MTNPIRPELDALAVVDVQPTFMPGGELPTPDGEAVVQPINRLLWAPFGLRFATQDWHPPGNVTFASRHPGRRAMERIDTDHGPRTLWPDHAVQGTSGAELHRGLNARALDLVLRKAAGVDLEGYSAFSDLGGRMDTGLAAMLRSRGVRRVFLAGLALDVCVAASAEDCARAGFETFIVEDACRASAPDDWPAIRSGLIALGVSFVAEPELTRASVS